MEERPRERWVTVRLGIPLGIAFEGTATARRVLRQNVALTHDAPELAPYVRETAAVLNDAHSRGDRVLLEGSQGTALEPIPRRVPPRHQPGYHRRAT